MRAKDRDEILLKISEDMGSLKTGVKGINVNLKRMNGTLKEAQERSIRNETTIKNHVVNKEVHSKVEKLNLWTLGKILLKFIKIW